MTLVESEVLNQNENKRIAVFIPTLNEEETIGGVLEGFLSYFPSENIYVIDGNSSDRTSEIVVSKNINLITQNGDGKGKAVIQALNLLSEEYDYSVIIDGDMTYDPLEMTKFIKLLEYDDYDLILGDRLRGERESGAITQFNLVGNWIFSFLIRILHGGPLTDSQTGFRMLSKELIQFISGKLSSHSFEIESEIGIYAARGKFKITNVPISYKKRPENSLSKLNPFKVGFKIIRKIVVLRFKRI